jgi:transposase InsO family protein
MSAQTSPHSGKAYGVERVCRVFEVARSSYYEQQKAAAAIAVAAALTLATACAPAAVPSAAPTPRRRGPKPEISDDELLELIKADLASSPFSGEGYRKVWARLRIGKGVGVAPKRVLRLMRENNLLSPHRARQGCEKLHEGTIITEEPNIMWGTDGLRAKTVDDNWIWIFTAVEHWNSECVGFHVCKQGTRYAALEPISQGIARIFGTTEAGAARGLSLRMDHGSQYISEHFLNQVRYWGITPSFAFVGEPQTNGVAERFNRTLKEQAINGREFQNLDAVRRAVADFVERYNKQWRVEKIGFKTPLEAREGHALRAAA